MSIEIRHIVVNATIQGREDSPQARKEKDFDSDQFRDEVLEACNNLIRRFFRQRLER